MSWLRGSPFPFGRQLSRALDPHTDYEPGVCFQSFTKHWQQARDIIFKSRPQNSSLHDDVLGVVNHVEQIATLLQLEARARQLGGAPASPPACLEHLLSENLLDRLYEWGKGTGRYVNAVRLEQLKLYSCLVSGYSGQLLAAEPFLRPLLKLLTACGEELLPTHVEGYLVKLLSQICVVLMQSTRLIDLFFITNGMQNGQQSEFILVRLLLSCVHREGSAGAVARDAMLLCAKMTTMSETLAQYMLLNSNVCVVLATGLSGLYSRLPRSLCELGNDSHRLTSDHVNRVDKLPLFINSLEFCNAVAQVAHPSIKRHLLDFLYQGFLVPVMGPALLQSGLAEQIAAVAYLELSLRCVSAPGLLRPLLKFLMVYEYDGVRVLDVMLTRLEGDSQLSLATLALIETLVDLNCEDVMLELVYKYLLNGQHLMVSHRARMCDAESYREAAVAFLALTPDCCSRSLLRTREWAEAQNVNGRRATTDARAREERRLSRDGGEQSIAMCHLVQDTRFNYGNPNETLLGNYHSYLCDARHEIATRTLACSKWSSKYDGTNQKPIDPTAILGIVNEFQSEHEILLNDTKSHTKERDSCISNSYERIKSEMNNNKEQDSLMFISELNNGVSEAQHSDSSGKEQDSLTSLGESSGYESFKYRPDQDEQEETLCDYAEESFWKKSNCVKIANEDFVLASSNRRGSAEFSIGPLLTVLIKKVSKLLEADVHTTVRVTGLISKLAAFPAPLSASLLLCAGLLLQPSVPSLYQILSKLKQEVDGVTRGVGDVSALVDEARTFLIRRELALTNYRKQAVEPEDGATGDRDTSLSEAVEGAPPPPLRRSEPKRRSISTSISNMFNRKLASSGSPVFTPHSLPTPPSPKPNFTNPSYWDQSVTRRSVLNAVIIDEWLKELSAIAHEHALVFAGGSAEELVSDALCS